MQTVECTHNKIGIKFTPLAVNFLTFILIYFTLTTKISLIFIVIISKFTPKIEYEN